MKMIKLPFDIKAILAAIGGFLAFIFYKLKISSAKKKGTLEAVEKIKTQQANEFLDITVKTEKINEDYKNLSTTIPNDWDSIGKLRDKGHRSLREISTAAMRKKDDEVQ